MFYSIKTKLHAVNLSEIIKVSSYYFAKSKIAQKRAKIFFLKNRQKKSIRAIKFLMTYLDLEDQKLVVCHSSGYLIEN